MGNPTCIRQRGWLNRNCHTHHPSHGPRASRADILGHDERGRLNWHRPRDRKFDRDRSRRQRTSGASTDPAKNGGRTGGARRWRQSAMPLIRYPARSAQSRQPRPVSRSRRIPSGARPRTPHVSSGRCCPDRTHCYETVGASDTPSRRISDITRVCVRSDWKPGSIASADSQGSDCEAARSSQLTASSVSPSAFQAIAT